MKKGILCSTIIGVLMLGLTIPGVASAGYFGWGCSLQGTWFGVEAPENTVLTGWVVTVTGKSHFRGTNNLEHALFDATLSVPFEPFQLYPDADRLGSLRGVWMRTGFNTFAYTMTGIAVDADGAPVWVGKLSGNITLSDDCKSEEITATLKTFAPLVSPFDGEPEYVLPLPTHYGYRAYLDLP